MSQHWTDNRHLYASFADFHSDAVQQKHEEILALTKRDPIKTGVTYEAGHRRFDAAHAMAIEVFPGRGPFERIHLRPDPWKSEGSWRVLASGISGGIEGNVGSDTVRRYFG